MIYELDTATSIANEMEKPKRAYIYQQRRIEDLGQIYE